MPTPAALDPAQLVGYRAAPYAIAYSERAVALYALGVGAPADPLDADELKFVYEFSGAGFVALPTFSTIALARLVEIVLGGLPGLPPFNPMMVVHGEHAITLHQATPTATTLTAQPTVSAVYDKGSGALLVIDFDLLREDGVALATHTASLFVRGMGGFGGERGPASTDAIPQRPPDATITQATTPTQALLYRLSGDTNPLHADPALAAAGGFDRPILHGLCSYGFAARALLKAFGGNDPSRLRSIRARFAKPVFPGDVLTTELWQDGESVAFRTRVAARDEIVLANGAAEMRA